jgi:hypothetical protein
MTAAAFGSMAASALDLRSIPLEIPESSLKKFRRALFFAAVFYRLHFPSSVFSEICFCGEEQPQILRLRLPGIPGKLRSG